MHVQRAQTLRNAGQSTAGQETETTTAIGRGELGQGGAPGMNQAGRGFHYGGDGAGGGAGVRNVTPDVINAQHARIGGIVRSPRSALYDEHRPGADTRLPIEWQRYSRIEGDRAGRGKHNPRHLNLAQLAGRIPEIYRLRHTALLDMRGRHPMPTRDTNGCVSTDAMERSIQAAAGTRRGQEILRLAPARQQYANLMVVEDAMLLARRRRGWARSAAGPSHGGGSRPGREELHQGAQRLHHSRSQYVRAAADLEHGGASPGAVPAPGGSSHCSRGGLV
jgi:hypothetical protein